MFEYWKSNWVEIAQEKIDKIKKKFCDNFSFKIY